MNELVKLLSDDDGYEIPKSEQRWHLKIFASGSPMLLCTSEVYGVGEGAAVGVEKETIRGGITCDRCIRDIKRIKAVRL